MKIMLCKTYLIWLCLTQWFTSMAAHWYNQGSFIKIPMPEAHPTPPPPEKSILIDLEWGLCIDFLFL